jgi:manganese/zinc-transporting P-type ATPase C
MLAPIVVEKKQPRVITQKNGLTIWSTEIFSEPGGPNAREFLSRVFQLPEVSEVEIDARRGSSRLRFSPKTSGTDILHKLREVLIPGDHKAPAIPTRGNDLHIETAVARPVRVTRVGDVLSTWQVRMRGRNRVRLAHPALRSRKDVAFRLGEELTAILGVRDFRTNILTGSVVVRFDPRLLDVPHLVLHLERAWVRVLDGTKRPPPQKRFFASSSILALSFTGQFLLPAMNPFALVAVGIYGFPNVINALRMILRGRIGLPALYTGTLTFTLLSGMPLAAAFMATCMQTWPQVAHRRLISSQRRLFAAHRQRPTWARIATKDGLEVEVAVESLSRGSIVLVAEDEIIPADGVIVEGLAAIDEEALTGRKGAFDKATGDAVYASTFVKAGRIALRVQAVGASTMAGHIGALLPYGEIDRLPSGVEAEKIANGMVAPALALSAANLLLTGNVLPSQATIRPDYATSPRLSAQLTALHGIGDALRRGILLRDASVLDRLPATDIYVFDDSLALERRRISLGAVLTADDVSRGRVLGYACAAFPMFQNERARSLLDACVREQVPIPGITRRIRDAGVIRYRDEDGQTIEIATPAYLAAKGCEIPTALEDRVSGQCEKAHRFMVVRHQPEFPDEPQLRPLWVLRAGEILGAVTFQRSGELEAVEVIETLRARNRQASFVYVTDSPQTEAEKFGAELGITACHGELDSDEKARLIRDLGHRTMWIGDGSRPESAPCIEASEISISTAGARTLTRDAASVAFLQPTVRSLVPLRHLGRKHRAMLMDDYRAIFAANLFCVGGAFLGGFNTLAVSLVSNLGTGLVYTSKLGFLDSLIGRMERKMAPDVLGEFDEEDPVAGTTEAGRFEREPAVRYHEIDFDVPEPPAHPV